jgi:mono/diheme cytochrome c family protein
MALLILGLICFQGCYYDVVITEEEDGTEVKSFSGDVLPILRSSCATCHDGRATLPDMRDANAYKSLIKGNYISVSEPENSAIIVKIQSGHPYENVLSESEIQRIITWIKEGAADN